MPVSNGDWVFIEALTVDAVIGVYDWEKTTRQQLVFDLRMRQDNRTAAQRDRLDDAVDYDRVAKRITSFTADSRFELIETVAERCAEIILSEFSVDAVELTLRKPGAVKNAAAVGVSITRAREPFQQTPRGSTS